MHNTHSFALAVICSALLAGCAASGSSNTAEDLMARQQSLQEARNAYDSCALLSVQDIDDPKETDMTTALVLADHCQKEYRHFIDVYVAHLPRRGQARFVEKMQSPEGKIQAFLPTVQQYRKDHKPAAK